MNQPKKRGPSAYNTAYDELPEYFSIFPPHMWLFLVEVMLMMFGGAMLLFVSTTTYFQFSPESYFFGLILLTLSMSIPNFMITYGYSRGVTLLKGLCIVYIIYSLPSLYLGSSISGLLAITVGLVVYLITTTQKFRLLVLQRVKMGEWRRDQLEKNKIRREVIKERKAKQG